MVPLPYPSTDQLYNLWDPSIPRLNRLDTEIKLVVEYFLIILSFPCPHLTPGRVSPAREVELTLPGAWTIGQLRWLRALIIPMCYV